MSDERILLSIIVRKEGNYESLYTLEQNHMGLLIIAKDDFYGLASKQLNIFITFFFFSIFYCFSAQRKLIILSKFA